MKKLEPQDYLGAFKTVFQGDNEKTTETGFGKDQERLEERHKKERAAGRTLRQRARKPVRTAVINVRVEPRLKSLCTALADKLEASQADIIHEAILRLAEHEGIIEGGQSGQ